LDVALQRRFAFMEVMPRPDLLEGISLDFDGGVLSLDGLLRGLNRRIREQFDRDHQIGHSYFLTVKDAVANQRLERLSFVWNNQILPLLYEYFYNRKDRLDTLLESFKTDEDVEKLGEADGEDLAAALSKMVEQ
jgi:5-methylcytosine-specific restriction enzyme B